MTASLGGAVHRFVYDSDGRVMGEYGTSASDVIAETIWLSPEVANENQPLGGEDGVGGYAPLAVATGSGVSAALAWVQGNHLGVPLLYTDANGTAVTPASYTMPGFPGQMKTLGDLYYNRYRDYDSSLGRYIQADPIGIEGGSNPYAYANDNPLRWTDPMGLRATGGQVAGAAFEFWLQDQLRPTRRGLILPMAIGSACGTAIGAAIWYYNQPNNDDDDKDREYCRREWEDEKDYCWEKFGVVAWQYGACLDRARNNYFRCLAGQPHQGRWQDKDMGPDLPRPPRIKKSRKKR